jgi:spermidine/putrescine transport system ATP-binding protein
LCALADEKKAAQHITLSTLEQNMNATLLNLKNISMEYSNFIAVDDLNLDIKKGEFISLMGPSGCGKSTTLRMMAGLDNPTSGAIYLDGESQLEVPIEKRGTPMVWQNFALFPFLNVQENVEFPLRMKGVSSGARSQKAAEWIERMGLTEFAKRNISQLSGGQRQRVALARALVTEPRILLLDEPLSALDSHLRIKMQTELVRLHKELGITFVYVTHSQSEAFTMSDRVVVMNQGKVQQIGTPKEIYRAPDNAFVAEFIGMNNLMSGTISHIEDSTAEITTDLGVFKAKTFTGAQKNTPSKLVIAADCIHLDDSGEQKVSGKISGEEFVGSVITLFIELENGQEFKVQKQQHEVESLNLKYGADLTLSWNAKNSFLLAS